MIVSTFCLFVFLFCFVLFFFVFFFFCFFLFFVCLFFFFVFFFGGGRVGHCTTLIPGYCGNLKPTVHHDY